MEEERELECTDFACWYLVKEISGTYESDCKIEIHECESDCNVSTLVAEGKDTLNLKWLKEPSAVTLIGCINKLKPYVKPKTESEWIDSGIPFFVPYERGNPEKTDNYAFVVNPETETVRFWCSDFEEEVYICKECDYTSIHSSHFVFNEENEIFCDECIGPLKEVR
jgi:hypothetical protein